MKCSYHPQEYIRCININLEYINPNFQDRFLCFDCYTDQLMDGVPNSHIYKIQKIIENPRLLFSLQEYGYDKFNYIQSHRDRYFAIVDVYMNFKKEFDKIKQLVRQTTEQLLNQLNEYTTMVQQLWKDYDSLNDYVWDYIGYNGVEAHLKSLISEEPINYDQYDEISQDLNMLFQKLNLENHDEFKKKYNQIMTSFNSMKNMDIISIWKQNQEFSKSALIEFKGHHEEIFCMQIQNKPSKLQLQEQIAQLKQKKQCCVCMSNEATYAAIPCGHYAYCEQCKDQIRYNCSLCKTQVKTMNKIFI